MKTKLIAIAFVALSVSACHGLPRSETTSCSFDLDNNQKTCNMSESERNDIMSMTAKAKDNVKVVDGVSYREEANGTLTPIQ
jgi:hypothetical protein